MRKKYLTSEEMACARALLDGAGDGNDPTGHEMWQDIVDHFPDKAIEIAGQWMSAGQRREALANAVFDERLTARFEGTQAEERIQECMLKAKELDRATRSLIQAVNHYMTPPGLLELQAYWARMEALQGSLGATLNRVQYLMRPKGSYNYRAYMNAKPKKEVKENASEV